jgi:hypothetical protein
MQQSESKPTPRKNRTIVMDFIQAEYELNIYDASYFRSVLDSSMERHPELFPFELRYGYQMKDLYLSKKLSITIRRIKVTIEDRVICFTIRPSFIMPYLTGMAVDVEKPLMLRKFAVPFWALSYCFGRDPMYWYRMEASLGRYSIVGTTVRSAEKLPLHLAADEKHTKIKGEKAYIPCTVGNDCILGVALKKSAGQADLEEGYRVFKNEAQNLKPDYCPDSVNTDGWLATINSWKSLFPATVLIACFLHIYIGIRDRSRKKYKDLFEQVSSKLWECYEADSKRSFSQRVRRIYEWGKASEIPIFMMDKIEKIRNNLTKFTKAYDLPGSHRTSNMIDRLMQRMDRYLFNTQYFHGNIESAERGIRAWALIHNFAPSNPRTVQKYNGLQSPAERLNGFHYHGNWLQNLLISGSLGGFRSSPQNPI